jgi:lysophospholipase
MPRNPAQTRQYPASSALELWPATDGWSVRFLGVEPGAKADGPQLGSVFLMGGRGDFIEKYMETIHNLRDAGYVVGAMDWRGQGGSGRLSPNQYVGHADDFAVWVDDLAHFWARWQAQTPGPHFIIGHSMGGHLVLRALAEAKIDPQAVVLVAPMLGYRGALPLWLGQSISGLMCRIGDPQRSAWKVSEKPGSPIFDRAKLLTHDADRYADEAYWHTQIPALAMGPASWGWVRAGYQSMRMLTAESVLAKINTPILMLVADADGLVNPPRAIRAAAYLPNAALVRYGPEAAHELLREVDAVRNDVLTRIHTLFDQFRAQK